MTAKRAPNLTRAAGWDTVIHISVMQQAGNYFPIVVAPTFNNAGTLLDILGRIDAQLIDVLVVDDGSTDSTATILQQWQMQPNSHGSRRLVLPHDRNHGKAAALLSAFSRARELGYTHAITIDTDGQLEPEQIPLLLTRSREHPSALILGCRDASAADYPKPSRIGRWASNTLVRWESGAAVADSQCGFRVYPLNRIARLDCRWGRYGFETEVLARAAWAGVPLRTVEVRCAYDIPQGRVSHFKPWRDSWSAAAMHLALLSRSSWPTPVLRLGEAHTGTLWRRFTQWISPMRAWRAVRHNPAERTRFAAGLATGVFIANLPLYGVQTLLSLFTAKWFRLHPLSVVVGSHASTPPIGPALIVAAITLGHWLLHGAPPRLASFDLRLIGYWELLRNVAIEWTIGGILCGATLALLTFATARLLMQWPTRPATNLACMPADQAIHPAPPVATPDPAAPSPTA